MLNTDQQNAVNHEFGPALIIAGPGSGKTTVITHHINFLISKLHYSPGEILVISFSKASANEMKQRFNQINPSAVSDILFGTFHSVFYKFIRSFSFNVPTLIDEKERANIINKIVENSDNFDKVSSFISYKKSFINPYKLNEDDSLTKLYERYQNILRECGLMDFDDILIKCYEMLSMNNKIRNSIRNKFRAILIDEFQDINEFQYETIKLIADNNLYVVGDEDQSIYSFRGAKSDMISRFYTDYPNSKVYYLKTNYRCHADIIDASQTVIKHNTGRFNKYDPIGINTDSGKHFEINKVKTINEELSFIVNKIKECNENNKNIAILVRTNNDILNYQNKIINYSEGNNDKINKLILKIFYSYLSFVLYKSDSDLYFIINIPERNIPRSILNQYLSKNISSNKFLYQNEIEKFNKHIDVLSSSSPLTFTLYVWNIIGVKNYIYDSFADEDNCEIDSIFNEVVNKFKEFNSLTQLYKYLFEHISIIKEQDKLELKNIKIMTFHASKGLEFDAVIIPNVIEGVIPGRISIGNMNIEEERRLFYVAMTRAKEYLSIITLENPESSKYIPSRFLDGLI